MRFHSLVFASLALLCGCAATSSDPGSSANADTATPSTPLWDESKTTELFIEVAGSGVVPSGSQCAPGARDYFVEYADQKIESDVCVGTPLRWQKREDLILTPDVSAQVATAMNRVDTSPAPICDPSPTPFVDGQIVVSDGSTVQFGDDAHACDTTADALVRAPARGLPAVVAVLDALARPTLTGPIVAYDPPPASFWSSDMTSLAFTASGYGVVPTGASCVPGDAWYLIERQPDGTWNAYADVCEQPPNEPLPLTTRSSTTLDDDTIANLQKALAAVTITTSPTCSFGTPYVNINVWNSTTDDEDYEFTNAGSGCSPGVDVGPFADFANVLGLLQMTLGN